MPQVLDIEQAVLLLEIEAPFDKRDIQLARRRQAKRWHPDIAPAGKQLQHERHLKAINEAADQLEQLAEESRGGRVSRNAVKVSAAAAHRRPTRPGTTRSDRACPTTPSCTATRAASPTPSGASAPSTASTSRATATTSSNGRASRSTRASARCRRGRCSSSTSRAPTPGPSGS